MKYALVTGGSRGIGKAVALKLANQGWPVLINYRSNQEAAQATLDEIVTNGRLPIPTTMWLCWSTMLVSVVTE